MHRLQKTDFLHRSVNSGDPFRRAGPYPLSVVSLCLDVIEYIGISCGPECPMSGAGRGDMYGDLKCFALPRGLLAPLIVIMCYDSPAAQIHGEYIAPCKHF